MRSCTSCFVIDTKDCWIDRISLIAASGATSLVSCRSTASSIESATTASGRAMAKDMNRHCPAMSSTASTMLIASSMLRSSVTSSVKSSSGVSATTRQCSVPSSA